MDPKEYCDNVVACFKDNMPSCKYTAVIPTMVQETTENIKGLSNVLVRVTGNNTTYYVDDKHRITTVCSEPYVENNYDFENNPKRIRNQLVFDYATNKAAYYNKSGERIYVATGNIKFNDITDRPSYNNATMTSNTNIPKVPSDISELDNDAGYQTASDVQSSINAHSNNASAHQPIQEMITAEATTRADQDLILQNQIDAINSSSDVVDIVGTYSALQAYDTQYLKPNDIIKVLVDETHSNAISYYRWRTDTTPNAFAYIGSQGPFYTKSEADALLNEKVSNTDYATSIVGGVFKSGNSASLSNGTIQAEIIPYQDYSLASNNSFISKGTLEGVMSGRAIEFDITYVDDSTETITVVGA